MPIRMNQIEAKIQVSARTTLAHVVGILGAAISVGCGHDVPAPIMVDDRPTYVIGDEVACETCSFAFDTIASISGSIQVPFYLATKLTYMPDVKMFAAAPLLDVGTVALYDSAGTYQRSIFRAGEGPGELRRIRFALDGGRGRLSAIAIDGKVVRYDLVADTSIDLRMPASPLPTEMVAGGTGGSSFGTRTFPSFRFGIAVDSSFQEISQFGDTAVRKPDGSFGFDGRAMDMRVGVGPGGQPLTLFRHFRYEVVRWGPDGSAQEVWTRAPVWFPAYTSEEFEPLSSYFASQYRSFPEGVAVFSDDHGLIWTVIRLADADWHQADPIVEGKSLITVKGGVAVLPERDWNDFLDTMIEVFDPATRRVVARVRADGFFSRLAAPGVLTNMDTSPNGELRIHAVRVSLSGYP